MKSLDTVHCNIPFLNAKPFTNLQESIACEAECEWVRSGDVEFGWRVAFEYLQSYSNIYIYICLMYFYMCTFLYTVHIHLKVSAPA